MKILLSWLCEHIELNLETAVRDAKLAQDLELESLCNGAGHSRLVKDHPTANDSGSRDCVKLASPIAVSRLNQDVTAEAIGKALTQAGLEVDAITLTDTILMPKGKSQKSNAHLTSDYVFDISLTPNLGHCSSVLGVARELAAAGMGTLKSSHIDIALIEDASSNTKEAISIEVKCPTDAPAYAARLIKGVKVTDSPDWIKKRLEASGIRSVNNVVDVTNYVMLELNHPLHAFDFHEISKGKLIVRNAKEGETIVTLDGKTRTLFETDVVIADEDKPLSLAGIMGGASSEVKETTTDVLLEAACFLGSSIRKTSKRHGLMTDASKRFERGCDPNILEKVLNKAAALITEVAGGCVLQGITQYAAHPFPKTSIQCRISYINSLLSLKLSPGEIESIFSALEFVFSYDGKNLYTVLVPTYRNDLKEEIDLVEEVARVYGYDNINKESCKSFVSTLPSAPMFLFEREIRARLISEGLQEFLTCDLIGPSLLEKLQATELPEKNWVRILNPVSIEQSIVRASLLPGLLHVVKHNWDQGIHDIAGFEIGRIHFKDKEKFSEQPMAGIILTGKSRPSHWDVKPIMVDFYDLKGIVENLVSELGIRSISFKKSALNVLHPGRQCSIFSADLEIGSFGELHPTILRNLDLPQRIYFAEINLYDMYKLKTSEVMMSELPIFPGSWRDLTLTLNDEIEVSTVLKAFHSIPSELLESVLVHDLYRSDALGSKKNVTFRFLYRDWNKTISQETVDTEHARIIAAKF